MNLLDTVNALYASGQHRQVLALLGGQLGPLLNLAGAAAYALGKQADAENYWRAAVCLHPDYADAHNNLGLLLADGGRWPEAESAYRRALQANPRLASAHNNLGIALAGQSRPAEAEAEYRQALAIRPDYVEAHNNLGNLLKIQGRHDHAVAAYRQALAINPRHAQGHNNLGLLLAESKGFAEAEAAYRLALAIQPDYVEAYNNLGKLLHETGRHAEAEAAYRQALALKPDYAPAYNNLGVICAAANRHAEAFDAYRLALALRPDFAEAYNNRGVLLTETLRHEEAETDFQRAIALLPGYAEAHNNLGVLLKNRKRYADSEAAYRQALRLRPDYADARFNLALLLLLLGRLAEAWPLYEARNHPDKSDGNPVPPLPFPQWRGEPLAGKSLLVWHEQGFGDDIQFCRFIPELKAQGAAAIGLVCRPPLAPLLATLAGLDAVHAEEAGARIPYYDYWTLPMSVPLHYGLTLDNIPAALPYLHALPERLAQWRARLPPAGPRVGLVWKSYPGHSNCGLRSLPGLATLAPLWTVPGVQFVSLQKGAAEDEARDPPPGLAWTQLGTEIQDFADSAAILAQLDLLISVDTAVVHLAGALGKPCWVMLPYQVDWRWQEQPADSDWYPQVMRLFRQSPAEDWDEVAGQVAEALRRWVGS